MGFDVRKLKSNTLGGFILHSMGVAGILGIFCFSFFAFYLPIQTYHDHTVVVPHIEGMSIEQLEKMLIGKSLTFEITDSAYAPEQAPPTIIKQFPQAGSKAKEGRKIFITVNRVNPPKISLPNILDGSIANAEAVLRSNELKLGKVETIAGPFKVVKHMILNGKMIDPQTEVPIGSVIDLIVMDGNSTDIGDPVPTLEKNNE